MSTYEELVERIAESIDGTHFPDNAARHRARAILAEVVRSVETVTPEMAAEAGPNWLGHVWLAMLRASPLTPS